MPSFAERARPLAALLLLCATAAWAASSEWVERSNRIAREILQERGRFSPEGLSAQGEEQYDTGVADLGPGLFERTVALTEKRLAALKAARAAEHDPKVRQDLDIMIDSRERVLETQRIEHQWMLRYYTPAPTVRFGLTRLLEPRANPTRKSRALVRLRRYAGLEPGYTPIVELARARTEEELARPGLVGPYVEELKQELATTDIYLRDLREHFETSGVAGWEQDFGVLEKQLREYDAWLREQLLPRARTELRLPAPVYANRLRQAGVDIGPEELIERAGFDFQEVREQMQVLARQVAAARGLPSSDYRDVLRALKKEQIPPERVLELYRGRLKEIEAILRRERLVTLPEREAVIRLATEAEAANTPAPQMRAPRLIGNRGERGEFILPLANPHAKDGGRMDDFSYDAVAWTLTAHEARPGHELQYAAMVERGVSLARALFAFNSANVEGWALYAEALMLLYMPPEAQLVSLQWRLLRMARAFLDPMVNLGRITREQAMRVLTDDVVLSEPFAQQEVDRYAFNMPGQATAYYYGYLQLRTLRTQAELVLGPRFDLMAFNDFIVREGVLPPRILRQAVMEEFVRDRRPK